MWPAMGVLTPRKVTICCALVINSSNDNDLLLVKHDTRVDRNHGGARIHYTQEAALAESPPCCPPPYTMSRQRTGVGYGKVLIPNPDYNGKDHTELILSNPDYLQVCQIGLKTYTLQHMEKMWQKDATQTNPKWGWSAPQVGQSAKFSH
jgi:hypothetical protein